MAAHKFNAKRTVIDGEKTSFPSQLEANVFCYHRMLEKSGHLKNLTRKATVAFPGTKIRYQCDMKYETVDGKTIWVEAKGMETDRWKIIKRLWETHGPGVLEVWKAKGRGVYLAQTIEAASADESA